MKIIEAMKQCKDLARECDEILAKIKAHCAYPSMERPVYQDQTGQVSQWIQSRQDKIREIIRLKCSIADTNHNTTVAIKVGMNTITRTIAEWILRRRIYAALEADSYKGLTDRGIKEGYIKNSQSGEVERVEIVRCYSPELRDKTLTALMSEPSLIDATLEVINAVTDLLE